MSSLPFFKEVSFVVLSGGVVMIPLAILSVALYGNIIALLVFVKRIRFTGDDAAFSAGAAPGAGSGEGAMSASLPVSPGESSSFHPGEFDFEELRWRLRHFVSTRLGYIQAMLIAAPLLGLLGTVMGMLTTFHGLSLQAGLETAKTVADGVSRALITTQTGLMIAIPGLFISMWIRRLLRSHEQRILELKVRHQRNTLADAEAGSC